MRSQIPLRTGWYLRAIEHGSSPDVSALSRTALELRAGAALAAGWFPTTVPAQVHDVLAAHGRIPDPRSAASADAFRWVSESDWLYATTFPTPESAGGPTVLRLLGLDTLATVTLNGEPLGSFASMYCEHSVDVTSRLAPAGQRNVLLIHFYSPRAGLAAQDPPAGVPAHHLLRKAEADWQPEYGARDGLQPIGITRDVLLDLRDRAWIDDIAVRTELDPAHTRATVRVQAEVSRHQAWLHWSLADPSGAIVARGDTEAGRPFAIAVPRPLLWWPHTCGQPSLYALGLHLTSEGEPCEERQVWVGIRDVRRDDRDPATLAPVHRFVVNGRAVFLQGACWGTVDGASHCWPADRADRLLDLARRANLNALRVTGGDPLPDDAFYDACDRRGILVLQDLPFAGGPFPEEDPAFMRQARADAEGLVRRLRNHACLAGWSGGDGIDASGSRLLGSVLPEIVARLDAGRPYQSASPFGSAPLGGTGANWPLRGDWHDDTATSFSAWTSVPAFASAVGRVSAPTLPTLRRALTEAELWPAGHDAAIRSPGQVGWPAAWARHAPAGSWEEIGPLERFPEAASAEELVRNLGTAQADYLAERIERQRRGQPDGLAMDGRRSWGCLVRRLADPWPSVGAGLVDSDLAPKIAWYAVRRACSPVLVTFERTADEIAVSVVNDSAVPVVGTLVLRALLLDGTLLGEVGRAVEVAPGCVAPRRLSAASFGLLPLYDTILSATLGEGATTGEFTATLLLAPERRVHLPPATLRACRDGSAVILSTDCYCRQVRLEADGPLLVEDNYFDLLPGETRRIGIVDAAGSRTLIARALNAAPQTVRLC